MPNIKKAIQIILNIIRRKSKTTCENKNKIYPVNLPTIRLENLVDTVQKAPKPVLIEDCIDLMEIVN